MDKKTKFNLKTLKDKYYKYKTPNKVDQENQANQENRVSQENQADQTESNLEEGELNGIENDNVIERDYLSSLIEQEDRLVYYEVENIFKNPSKKNYINRLKLKKDPPVLIIRDDYDNEAFFYLTENLTDDLIGTLKEVKRAYNGFNGPNDLNMPDKFSSKIIYYIKKNPLKIGLTVILLITLIIVNIK